MAFLWEWGGLSFPIAMIYPDEFESRRRHEHGRRRIAGNRAPLCQELGRTDREHHLFVADMAFGSLPYEAASRSVELFAEKR